MKIFDPNNFLCGTNMALSYRRPFCLTAEYRRVIFLCVTQRHTPRNSAVTPLHPSRGVYTHRAARAKIRKKRQNRWLVCFTPPGLCVLCVFVLLLICRSSGAELRCKGCFEGGFGLNAAYFDVPCSSFYRDYIICGSSSIKRCFSQSSA